MTFCFLCTCIPIPLRWDLPKMTRFLRRHSIKLMQPICMRQLLSFGSGGGPYQNRLRHFLRVDPLPPSPQERGGRGARRPWSVPTGGGTAGVKVTRISCSPRRPAAADEQLQTQIAPSHRRLNHSLIPALPRTVFTRFLSPPSTRVGPSRQSGPGLMWRYPFSLRTVVRLLASRAR